MHPFLIYVLISVIVILLFLLNKENAGYVLVNYLSVLIWTQNIMGVSTIGVTNSRISACSQ